MVLACERISWRSASQFERIAGSAGVSAGVAKANAENHRFNRPVRLAEAVACGRDTPIALPSKTCDLTISIGRIARSRSDGDHACPSTMRICDCSCGIAHSLGGYPAGCRLGCGAIDFAASSDVPTETRFEPALIRSCAVAMPPRGAIVTRTV